MHYLFSSRFADCELQRAIGTGFALSLNMVLARQGTMLQDSEPTVQATSERALRDRCVFAISVTAPRAQPTIQEPSARSIEDTPPSPAFLIGFKP